MKRYLYIPLFFALITTLTSFGFITAVLTSQLGQDSYIRPVQIYAVIAICVVATLCSLGLLISVLFELIGRPIPVKLDCWANKVIASISFVFCGLATWSFFLSPTDFYEDFLLKFTHSARFEFLMLGASALVMVAIRRFTKKSSN